MSCDDGEEGKARYSTAFWPCILWLYLSVDVKQPLLGFGTTCYGTVHHRSITPKVTLLDNPEALLMTKVQNRYLHLGYLYSNTWSVHLYVLMYVAIKIIHVLLPTK